MNTNAIIDTGTPYDIIGLTDAAKKRLRNSVLQIALYAVIFTLSILAVIFFGSYIPVFIGGIILACASLLLGSKLLKNFAFADFSSARGEIADVHKEIKVIRNTKVGGINPFGVRKYDHDGKSEIRLGVFIKEGEGVRAYHLSGVTEEHAKYYEAKGDVIHIWGTHFPVKLEIGNDRWLCPICGEFNANEEKACARCKKKIIK